MKLNLSKTHAVLTGCLLSIAFFYYFAYAIADGASIVAIHALSPVLKLLKSSFGSSYSHAIGYFVAFSVGILGTALFLLPVRWLFGNGGASWIVSLLSIAPVVFVSCSNGVPSSLSELSFIAQPIVGTALIYAEFEIYSQNEGAKV